MNSILRPLAFSWCMMFSGQKVAELSGSRKAYIRMVLLPLATLTWTGTIAKAHSLLAPVAWSADASALLRVLVVVEDVFSEGRWSEFLLSMCSRVGCFLLQIWQSNFLLQFLLIWPLFRHPKQWPFHFKCSTFLSCRSDWNFMQSATVCWHWQKVHDGMTALEKVLVCFVTVDGSLVACCLVACCSAGVTVVTKLLPPLGVLESKLLVLGMGPLMGGGSLMSPNTGCKRILDCVSKNSTRCLNRTRVFLRDASYTPVRHRSRRLYGHLERSSFKLEATSSSSR